MSTVWGTADWHARDRWAIDVCFVRTASDSELEAMRAHVRANAADRPGVYRMLSADGEIVYVGKSKQVRSRLLSYFRCEYPEEKGARILREARSIDWEYCPSEFAALITELRLIKRLRPRYNVIDEVGRAALRIH